MANETVRVHFINGEERIVKAQDIRFVGEEGARSATALVDGREVPIYNRVEWGYLWYEQERRDESEGTALPEWAQQPTLSECPYCHQLHDFEQIQLCPLNPKNVVQ